MADSSTFVKTVIHSTQVSNDDCSRELTISIGGHCVKTTDAAAAKICSFCVNPACDTARLGIIFSDKWLVDMDLGKVFPNIGKAMSSGESSFMLPGSPVRKQVKDFHTVDAFIQLNERVLNKASEISL